MKDMSCKNNLQNWLGVELSGGITKRASFTGNWVWGGKSWDERIWSI